MKVTRVVSTLNNYTTAAYEALKAWAVENCKYVIIGKEVGESGTPHLQMFFILKKQQRISAVTNQIKAATKKQPWTHKANGTNDEAADYIKNNPDKPNPIFWEHGTYPKGKGTRTDIKDFLEAVHRGADNEVLAKEYPNEFAKYHAAADKLRRTMKQKRGKKRTREHFEKMPLRNWQADCLESLMAQDDRKVTWIVDEQGNSGKSWFANWLAANKDAYIVEGGKTSDIAYAYNYEEIVCFDFTRCQEERINYAVIESFKNGRIFSAKYESGLKVFAPAKVLCLSNFNPDRSKLSADRWDIKLYNDPMFRQTWMAIPPEYGPPPRKKRRLYLDRPPLERQDCETDILFANSVCECPPFCCGDNHCSCPIMACENCTPM